MGRTLRYFQWKSSQWLSLRPFREQLGAASTPTHTTAPTTAPTPLTTTTSASSTDTPSAAVPPPIEALRGLDAYASRQARIYETLIVSFANRWRAVLTPNNLGSDWLRQYPIAPDPLSAGPSRGHSRPTVKPSPVQVSKMTVQADPPPPLCPILSTSLDLNTDPPMESDAESDAESDNDSDYGAGDGDESDFD